MPTGDDAGRSSGLRRLHALPAVESLEGSGAGRGADPRRPRRQVQDGKHRHADWRRGGERLQRGSHALREHRQFPVRAGSRQRREPRQRHVLHRRSARARGLRHADLPRHGRSRAGAECHPGSRQLAAPPRRDGEPRQRHRRHRRHEQQRSRRRPSAHRGRSELVLSARLLLDEREARRPVQDDRGPREASGGRDSRAPRISGADRSGSRGRAARGAPARNGDGGERGRVGGRRADPRAAGRAIPPARDPGAEHGRAAPSPRCGSRENCLRRSRDGGKEGPPCSTSLAPGPRAAPR